MGKQATQKCQHYLGVIYAQGSHNKPIRRARVYLLLFGSTMAKFEFNSVS